MVITRDDPAVIDHIFADNRDFCRAMLRKRGLCRYAVSVRPSVCPSVRLSRLRILSTRINVSSTFFHHSSFSIPNVMATFRREPLTEASNAGEVGRNRDSEPISGFIACCQRCDWLSTRRRRTVASCDTYHW